jgi:hypothetical protein
VKTVVKSRPPADTCATLLSMQCLLKSSSEDKVEAVVKTVAKPRPSAGTCATLLRTQCLAAKQL